jgi:hypothetical protein
MMMMAPAIGVIRRCGFCAINLSNISYDDILGVETVLDAGANRNPRTASLFSREYCSEYCVIQDVIATFSHVHKAAYIARMKENRPHWLAETFDRIAVVRGGRAGQVAPANYTKPASDSRQQQQPHGGKYCRMGQPNPNSDDMQL